MRFQVQPIDNIGLYIKNEHKNVGPSTTTPNRRVYPTTDLPTQGITAYSGGVGATTVGPSTYNVRERVTNTKDRIVPSNIITNVPPVTVRSY